LKGVTYAQALYRTLASHITKKAGYNKQMAQTGAVTLIQRFVFLRQISLTCDIDFAVKTQKVK
jgi:hypothetical protein